MSYSVITTKNFKKEAKQLSKKYPKLKTDLAELNKALADNPILFADRISRTCYKVRMTISGKPGGKSAGARIIIQVLVEDSEVYLLSIYDKSEKSNILDKELTWLIAHKLDE